MAFFRRFSTFTDVLCDKMVFIQKHEHELIGLDVTSYIYVFHFADDFSLFPFTNSLCGLGIKHQTYTLSLYVLLLRSGGVLCSFCDAFITYSNRIPCIANSTDCIVYNTIMAVAMLTSLIARRFVMLLTVWLPTYTVDASCYVFLGVLLASTSGFL